MRFMRVCLLGLGIMTLAAGPAMSAITTYSNMSGTPVDNSGSGALTNWEAAVTAMQLITFNSASFDPSKSLTYDWSTSTYTLVTNPPTLTSTQANFCRMNSAGTSCNSEIDLGVVPGVVGNKFLRGYGTPSYIRTLLPSGIVAVGLDLWTYTPGNSVTVRLYSDSAGTAQIGTDYTFTTPSSHASGTPAGFFGVTSDTSIALIRVLSSNNEPIVDAVRLSNALNEPEPPPPSETPEVPTLGYVGIGFLAVILGSKRKFLH